MRALFLTIFFSGIIFYAQSQTGEVISPLLINTELSKNRPEQKMFNDLFIYEIDTIRMPFVDDFSSNKFKKYDAEAGDPNVTTQIEYQLYDASNTTPLVNNLSFRTSATFRITYDTVGVDTTIYTRLDSTQITLYDLSTYPFSTSLIWVWPSYNIYDTLFSPPEDTIALTPELTQDSVYIHFVAATDNAIWQDNGAYRNDRFPVNPPTVGVATLDGLDEYGYPYDFSTTTSYGIADYLTSKPINLGFDIFNNPYTAADSIYLSFYYQPGGKGDMPEGEDSLFLEFWSPSAQTWIRVWSIAGFDDDSIYRQENIRIDAGVYLQNGFKFRFGNYGVLSGSLDHWNIDYVFLNEFRTQGDTIRDDVAFQYVPQSLLKDYSSIPWEHYKLNPASYMADTLSTFQRNNADVGHLVGNNFMEIDFNGINLNSFAHPNTPSVSALTNYSTLWDVGLQPFIFDTTVNDTCATFDVSFRHQATPDFERENDTVRMQQVFENYYAYDDGSAEFGYGLNDASAKIAYKFYLQQPDSIRALQIHFIPDVINVEGDAFLLTIWDATGSGGKPNNIIFQNSIFSTVEYDGLKNGFREYEFDEPVLLPAGNYYVGTQQLDANPLNIGMDINTNRKDKIYFNVSGSWLNTSQKMALMMRPVFTCECDLLLMDVPEETDVEPEPGLVVFPNPTQHTIFLENLPPNSVIYLRDISGNIVFTTKQNLNSIDVSSFANGLYLLQYIHNGISGFKKIVINK